MELFPRNASSNIIMPMRKVDKILNLVMSNLVLSRLGMWVEIGKHFGDLSLI